MSETPFLKAEAKYALVIGNSNYSNAPLKNPANDASAVGDALSKLDFNVAKGMDLAAPDMLVAVSTFCRELMQASERGEDVSAVLFFAGHGIQVDGENYLLPIDADIRNVLELRTQTVALNIIMEAIGRSAQRSVIILDCCRNNPLPRTLGDALYRGINPEHGLAHVHAPKGVYVAFATQPHFVALDGEGTNSPFTQALTAHVNSVGLPVSQIMMRVRLDVYKSTRGEQIPWDHSALFEPFYFAKVGAGTDRSDLSPEVLQQMEREQEAAIELSYWHSVKSSSNIRFIQGFLSQFPNSTHREAALERIEVLQRRAIFTGYMMWGTAALAAIALTYLGVTYAFRFKQIENAQIVGDDIKADEWRETSSHAWCKVRCTVHPQCVGFTYHPGRQRCQLKSEAPFVRKSNGRNPDNAAYSEVLSGYVDPRRTTFKFSWGRGLTGAVIPSQEIETRLPELKSSFRQTWRGDKLLRLSSTDCLEACEVKLNGVCKAFTHSTWRGCELYSLVEGPLLDPRDQKSMFLPGTISGCSPEASEPCERRARRN